MNVEKMTLVELKEWLRARNLLVSGKKADLIARVKEQQEEDCLPSEPIPLSAIEEEPEPQDEVSPEPRRCAKRERIQVNLKKLSLKK